MSDTEDSDDCEMKPSKSIKRVRFDDEISVTEFKPEYEESSFTEEPMNTSVVSDVQHTDDNDSSLNTNICLQNLDDSFEEFDEDYCVGEAVIDLASRTENLNISSELKDKGNEEASSTTSLLPSSSFETLPGKTAMQPAEEVDTSIVTRKRDSRGVIIEKQTEKVNLWLNEKTVDVETAEELKNTVYSAWYQVKAEKKQSMPINIQDPKKKLVFPGANASVDHVETLRKPKRRVKKIYRLSESLPEKTSNNSEEPIMAFRAWKKKKDELLKQQLAEKYRKEEKERLDSLLNERIRKSDAETAYAAWRIHKKETCQKEKREKQWIMKKEKEKATEKSKRNEESLHIYFEWLKHKLYISNNNSFQKLQIKPPWTPAGKANSLI